MLKKFYEAKVVLHICDNSVIIECVGGEINGDRKENKTKKKTVKIIG